MKKETGFPSPAQGYEAKNIDLNHLLINNPPATFFMQLVSADMAGFGFLPGSILIVDRSQKPGNGSFVVLRHFDELLCRELVLKENKIIFSNGKTDIEPNQYETEIIGTVRAIIKKL